MLCFHTNLIFNISGMTLLCKINSKINRALLQSGFDQMVEKPQRAEVRVKYNKVRTKRASKHRQR